MNGTKAKLQSRQAIELVNLIGEVFRWTRQSTDEFVRSHGITAPQLSILYRLHGEPGLTGAELARRSYITPQASYVALETLESKGLINRTVDPNNKRIVRASITSEGERILNSTMADMLNNYQGFGQMLDSDQMEHLIQLLNLCLGRSPD
jgi:DNA-binding MarR family transcriptional regulator